MKLNRAAATSAIKRLAMNLCVKGIALLSLCSLYTEAAIGIESGFRTSE